MRVRDEVEICDRSLIGNILFIENCFSRKRPMADDLGEETKVLVRRNRLTIEKVLRIYEYFICYIPENSI